MRCNATTGYRNCRETRLFEADQGAEDLAISLCHPVEPRIDSTLRRTSPIKFKLYTSCLQSAPYRRNTATSDAQAVPAESASAEILVHRIWTHPRNSSNTAIRPMVPWALSVDAGRAADCSKIIEWSLPVATAHRLQRTLSLRPHVVFNIRLSTQGTYRAKHVDSGL